MAEKKTKGSDSQRSAGGGQRQGAGNTNKAAGSGRKAVEDHSKDKSKNR